MKGAIRLAEGKTVPVPVVETPILEFSRGAAISIGPSKPRFMPETIVRRALSYVGKTLPYDPRHFNCQTFTSMVVSGEGKSPEAEAVVKALELAAIELAAIGEASGRLP
jgi:hypothetical protein